MNKQPNKFNYWTMDIETYIEICNLAMANGKKPGEGMEDEFKEVLKKKTNKIQLVGQGDKDLDLLTGNLREQGKKVFNLNEWERQQKKDNSYE